MVSIIGLNGSGKTTLLKSILGIYKPRTGKIIVNAAKIGYVPQNLFFDKTIPLSVFELLKVYTKKSEKAIKEKLHEVDAENLINKKIGQLSGGQLQRVLIANSLLMQPDLLLLDEPTASIDIVGEKTIYDLIKKIYNYYKITIVMVSHDIHMVFDQASKILCLNRKLYCSGTPKEISKNKEFKKIFGHNLVPYTHTHNADDN
jgi:zinc transport system ATP-binding protein